MQRTRGSSSSALEAIRKRATSEHVNIDIEHVTLVDPLIWPYGKLEGCSYQGGTLKVNGTAYPTTLFNTSTETFGKGHGKKEFLIRPLNYVVPNASQFDTVIVMNVLVYSNNAFEFLETLHRVLAGEGFCFSMTDTS